MLHVRSPRGEQATIPGTDDGIPWATGQYRFFATVTPADADLPNGTCDGIHVSVDANVTFRSADDSAAATVTLALRTGEIHPIGASRITAVSAGTATACYHRKPNQTV